MDRMSTPAGRLARRGFGDPHHAVTVIEPWIERCEDEALIRRLVDEILASADPDLAMSGFARLDAHPDIFRSVIDDPDRVRRVARVLGASVALNQHVCVRPEALGVLHDWPEPRGAEALRADLLRAVGADPDAPAPVAEAGTSDRLRLAYREALLRIAARDLTAPDPFEAVEDISRELADLADAVVEAALALARAEVPGQERVRLAVLAMGKCGARELNYVSDVDVVYVAEPALDGAGEPLVSSGEAITVATKLAASIARTCSAHTAAGTIWQVDANLRPEGKAGPLVRSLASMGTYYEKWAKNWEFQALLKARPMAGDRELGQEFVDLVAPRVWAVADDDRFVGETQAMRKRVIAHIPAKEADLEIKLGAGGLRDTEFSVQLLQLVHGRADERLRLRGTFAALDALVAAGYVGRADGRGLGESYRFQRVVEHRIQLFQLRRTHLMPTDELSLRRIARSMGLADATALTSAWRASTRRVLRLHQRIFYSPLLEAVARVPSGAVRLTSEAAETRLRALGFNDTRAALRHIEALSTGMSRPAEIQRQLLPAMLGWFADGPNPDHGLLAFRQVSEALGSSSWYLRALRDEGAMAENLARVLSSSRFAVDLLLRAPQTAQLLVRTDGLVRTRAEILGEMAAIARRHDDPRAAVEAIRGVRRQELLRIAMADLLGRMDVVAVGDGLTDVMCATMDAALDVARREVPGAPDLAIIALGRWGGNELSYSSDADAMVVVADADGDAVALGTKVISRLRELLRQPGADPAVELDLDLRPEGKNGPVVRTLASYRAYYEKWSSTWEAQALVRAGHGAGDAALSRELLGVIDAVRHPEGGISARQVNEIRRLKARMENERLPRGLDPRRHVKLGPGGLSDVEWCVQLLQLEYSHEAPALRTPRTLAALEAEVGGGFLSQSDAAALREAWVMATRIRNATMLLRGRASDAIPTDARERSAVAELLGYARGEASLLIDDWSRRARFSREVMDRVFWGLG
ncbi:bifunctional [glutamine synthetase] adenylyltransferase/[glutamine synthetase]-adenylyl-L-tyrosine phosphorylase [Propioniciclava sinopodophylli]|uniref:bifunctional [glutamine synthetase] adenylyltransferase/[glutamine synthetase]-adenylyl-L-tyrosine phosphorylase n=1 Tax=Propioniciclava sinopodophylli TaxID=1837344 RepID=UPI002491DB7D|nr:bifunctional [glutamine synthetase] adenylyltransferase/[glutamine synthetase]-adenylyl-L-tyrosine phosphorylase [Propioniciclava sinopodophylli]